MSERKERIVQQSSVNIVGANIKRLRNERKMKSIDVIAKLQLKGISVNVGTFSKVEHARNNPTVEMLIALTEIYNCDFNEFFVINN